MDEEDWRADNADSKLLNTPPLSTLDGSGSASRFFNRVPSLIDDKRSPRAGGAAAFGAGFFFLRLSAAPADGGGGGGIAV